MSIYLKIIQATFSFQTFCMALLKTNYSMCSYYSGFEVISTCTSQLTATRQGMVFSTKANESFPVGLKNFKVKVPPMSIHKTYCNLILQPMSWIFSAMVQTTELDYEYIVDS